MKVQPSVKKICDKCKVIRRHGRVMVICENPDTSNGRAKRPAATASPDPPRCSPCGCGTPPRRGSRGPTRAVGPVTQHKLPHR